ncbi:hypothetical protein SCLCIDRAFT_1212986 [Scleroderma citrinum Foug A]|uniref:Uncharacterized protein n=1 Tax=Scleroderma citrinum Foug A TaxID=1036808 RepID=A0A0C3EA64_9AGAM|nr:hypothetical protein SCLCIDRAFT_1212986 [Scleroderma citrinum Foug A]
MIALHTPITTNYDNSHIDTGLGHPPRTTSTTAIADNYYTFHLFGDPDYHHGR